jgi:hypothetical protein
MKCVVVGPVGSGGGSGLSPEDLKTLMVKARQIDEIVSRWLVSPDPIERQDLINDGQNNIKSGKDIIGGRAGVTEEQKKALTIFNAAVRYFNMTCLSAKE